MGKETEFFDLKEITNQKSKLNDIIGLRVLKKSKFYYGKDKNFREHIASYQGYAILLKQENLDFSGENQKEKELDISLVTLKDLKKMKKVNGNIVRKINPKSLHDFEKMAVVQQAILKIDE